MDARHYATVLVPTDLSPRAGVALQHAWRALGGNGTAHVVHVLEFPPNVNPMYAHYGPQPPTDEERAELRKEAAAHIRALLNEADVPAGITVHVHVVEDFSHDVVPCLCERAVTLKADLMCVASHGRRGLARLVMGSVAGGLLGASPVPVLVVPVPKDMLGKA